MSTVFRVLAGDKRLPTVGEVVSGTEQLLNSFLHEHGIECKGIVRFEIIEEHTMAEQSRPSLLRRIFPAQPRPSGVPRRWTPAPEDPFWWPEETYGWLSVVGVPGGADCYAWELNEPWLETIWSDELEDKGRPGHRMPLSEMFEQGREWSFRRSAGQPGVICLTYGLMAAQVAKLTRGVITSLDGAWGIHLLPAYADDFLEFYFRPNCSLNDETDNEWAARCIAGIKEDLSK